MIRVLPSPESLAAALLLLAAGAFPAQAAEPPERASTLVVYGDDPCPKARDGEEIVVCAHRPESERYRVPKEFRERTNERGSVAWGTRFEELDEDTRFTRPGSCSVVGTWGQTGCWDMAIRQWRADRRAAQASRDLP